MFLRNKTGETFMAGGGNRQTHVAFVRIVTRQGLPEAKNFIIDPIHAEARTIDQAHFLKDVRQKGIAAHRGVPKDVVRRHATDEAPGVRDDQAVFVQMAEVRDGF